MRVVSSAACTLVLLSLAARLRSVADETPVAAYVKVDHKPVDPEVGAVLDVVVASALVDAFAVKRAAQAADDRREARLVFSACS